MLQIEIEMKPTGMSSSQYDNKDKYPLKKN